MAGSKISSTAAQVKGIIDFIEHGGGVIDAQRRLIALESEIVTLEQRYLTLEQRALALTKENDELKERVSEMEQLEVERDGYDDYRLPSGAWVMAARRPGEQELGEPGMYLCRRCFTRRKYEVLQPVNHGRSLECHECRSVIEMGPRHSNELDINRWD